MCVFVPGAGEPEEDELYESGVLDSNGVYRLEGDKLVPHEDAWASIPSVTLLNSKEVTSFKYTSSEMYQSLNVSFLLPQTRF